MFYPELKDLFENFTVDGVSIPVALINYDGGATQYVVYREYDKDKSYSSEDNVSGYVTYFDFDIYSKSNFLAIAKAVKSKLMSSGWIYQPSRESPDMYDTDTGYFHKTLCFAKPIQIIDDQS